MNLLIRILLIALYYAIVTPLGLILRWMGVDYLNRSLDKGTSSYWITKAG